MRNTPTNELDQLLTVGEAAALLRCSRHSLNRWRLTGKGPKFIYVGRRVRYPMRSRPSSAERGRRHDRPCRHCPAQSAGYI
jgi:hypothetical protein